MIESPAGAPDASERSPAPPGHAAPAAGAGRAWHVAGAAALFVGVAGLLQLVGAAPYDADTAYHVAVGRLLAEHGILHAFPWTPFSWLSDHYADKELLFHLLLAPLAPLGWVAAAKLAGAALGGLALLVLFLVLRAERVPRAAIWALVPLAASAAFAVRFALVRPHLLSIALALAVTWAAARERNALLAGLAFLYPWCYVAWHLPLVLVALVEVARLLSGRRAVWRPLAAVILGVAAGVAVHPNAANLARLWWLVHVEILGRTAWAGKAGFELGGEFAAWGWSDFLRFALPPAAMALAAAALAWRGRARDPVPLAFAGAALAFLGLTAVSQRFIEYLAPFAVAALALAVRERARLLAAATLAASFVFTAAFADRLVLRLQDRIEDVSPMLASYLRRRIPPGDQVFTCDWGLTGALMWALPERRFIVALDPVLFHARDPELYRVWYELPRTGPADARAVIRSRFGARWAICWAREDSMPLLSRLQADPGVRTILDGPRWWFFDLKPERDADGP
jgi:hypothetical protein